MIPLNLRNSNSSTRTVQIIEIDTWNRIILKGFSSILLLRSSKHCVLKSKFTFEKKWKLKSGKKNNLFADNEPDCVDFTYSNFKFRICPFNHITQTSLTSYSADKHNLGNSLKYSFMAFGLDGTRTSWS